MTNNSNQYGPPKCPLSKTTISSAIDVACSSSNRTRSNSNTKSLGSSSTLVPNLQWKRGPQDHPSTSSSSPSTTLLYSIVGEIQDTVVSTGKDKDIDGVEEEDHPVVVMVQASFYLAYSTWDGRILYIDSVVDAMMEDPNAISESDATTVRPTEPHQPLIWNGYHILAHIAILLDCTRLTWQHTNEQTIVFPPNSCQPQTLHGWLTLHWEKESIIRFLGGKPPDHCAISTTTVTTPSRDRSLSFRDTIATTIQRCTATSTTTAIGSSPNVVRRLRLAGPKDTNTIGRLVQGLADYEKEPDAVHVTPDHYQTDGFQSDPPLFYCLLLETATTNTTTTTTTTTTTEHNDTTDWYACGIAFCWIGARHDTTENKNHFAERTAIKQTPSLLPEALFLYLEDLFIEEPYRGNGAGTFVMRTLGEIAVSLSCHKMVWQALDWNTPALTFYQNKIGARIVDGLLTTRFAGSALHQFHSGGGTNHHTT